MIQSADHPVGKVHIDPPGLVVDPACLLHFQFVGNISPSSKARSNSDALVFIQGHLFLAGASYRNQTNPLVAMGNGSRPVPFPEPANEQGSSMVRAGTSSNSGSSHRAWAGSKSMPCLSPSCLDNILSEVQFRRLALAAYLMRGRARR